MYNVKLFGSVWMLFIVMKGNRIQGFCVCGGDG